MKKKNLIPIALIGVLIVAACLYFVAFFWITPRVHDKVLEEFSNKLFEISLPENSSKTDSLSVVGQQFANGNHCDYLAAVLLKTPLSKAEVESYFKHNYSGSSQVQFVWLNEENIYTNDKFDPSKIYSLEEWLDQKSKATDASVAVYIFEGHVGSSFDYRCR